MTHFAVLTPPYPGHVNPMSALARELIGRGHRVTAVGIAEAEALFDAPGLSFAAAGALSHPPGTLARLTAGMGRTTELIGVGGVIRAMARMTDMLCLEAPVVLERIGAEAVVADATEAAGGLLARHLGLPQVSVANALLSNREPLVPPSFIGWAYHDSPWGAKRNLGGYRVADWMMRPMSEIITRYDRAWELGGLETVEDCLSATLQLSQTVPGFDFPRRRAPAGLVHVGPLRTPETGHWNNDDPRPGVFCSLGTLQGGRLPIFTTVAQACRELDLALVVAHGGKLAATEAAALPGRPRVESFVPQRAVMAGMAAVVAHGGLNTVLDALAAGRPLVVVPLAFEQGAIAARVARSGAGLVIAPRKLTPERLREALTRLLVEPAFRLRAAALAREIAGAGGVMRAVTVIEATVAPAVNRS
ncbi:MAG TPA: glycosyltransferase [Lichenihabitans sp.]|nr:glycosyltransferase [Lichenihabitans sp.]